MTLDRVTHRPLRDVLREASRTAHSRLDATFADQLESTNGYVGLLRLLQAFHASADPLLQDWVRISTAAPNVVIPSRASVLAGDLAFLGYPTGEPICLDGLPRSRGGVPTDPAGLALLCVVAGSSIGARVILGSLTEDIPRAARLGLAEGASVTSAGLWRQTLKVLAIPVDASVSDPATAACQLIFKQLQLGRQGEAAE